MPRLAGYPRDGTPVRCDKEALDSTKDQQVIAGFQSILEACKGVLVNGAAGIEVVRRGPDR